MFGSALLRCEGVRGFGFGIGCSGVIQMTQDGRRQVGIGRIGVGTVTVVTEGWEESAPRHPESDLRRMWKIKSYFTEQVMGKTHHKEHNT